jgi:hypothetical protein
MDDKTAQQMAAGLPAPSSTQLQGCPVSPEMMAFKTLEWARVVESGVVVLGPEGPEPVIGGRPLTIDEAQLYVAALECIRVAITGEERLDRKLGVRCGLVAK